MMQECMLHKIHCFVTQHPLSNHQDRCLQGSDWHLAQCYSELRQNLISRTTCCLSVVYLLILDLQPVPAVMSFHLLNYEHVIVDDVFLKIGTRNQGYGCNGRDNKPATVIKRRCTQSSCFCCFVNENEGITLQPKKKGRP